MRVAIVQKSVPQYRIRFFDLLRDLLSARDIELDLLYGRTPAGAASKADEVEVPWGTRIDPTYLHVGSAEIVWHPVVRQAMEADLVIVEQAARLLVNYPLQVLYLLRRRPRFAFWGHGRNFQANRPNSATEQAKRAVSRHVHWWFAYNQLSAAVVRDLGFPAERITVVQNAIDTRELRVLRAQLSPTAVASLRASLGITSENVCVFSGGMYDEKRLPFLIRACQLIRERVPDFHMLFLGAGKHAAIVRSAATQMPWIHYLGPRFGEDKVAAFALAKLHLMPGLVGLGVLDSFALATPMVTTAVTYHSPEIEYLTPDRGVIVQDASSVQAYADAAIALLRDDVRRAAMQRACEEASDVYTIETMAQNFSAGVAHALS